MNLVVIPYHDWKKCEREGFRTRDAHLMQQFSRHGDLEKMLVVNRPTSVAEMLLLRRQWHVAQGHVLHQNGGMRITQVGDRIFTLDVLIWEFLRPIIRHRRWIPHGYGNARAYSALTEALDLLGMASDYVLFLFSPLPVSLVRRLRPHAFVLDGLDNLLKHPFYRALPSLADDYQYCLDNARLLFANSEETTRWFQEQRPDAVHISNGVDVERFDPTVNRPVPADMRPFSRMRVGYAGKMQDMFDVELMRQAATRFAEVDFILIGQQLNRTHLKPLWDLANIHYLGDKHYADLPAYLAAFDICIIPYLKRTQHGGDPIKFYEYLAQGKPIVTTNIGNVGSFQHYPQVRIADTHQAFLDGLAHFLSLLAQGGSPEIRPVPETYTWQSKAARMVAAMKNLPGGAAY